MLFEYVSQTQRLIHDQRQQHIDPQDLIDYVNKARREVAMRSQCIRILTPISGSISSASVTAGGSGYTAPVVTISPPDFPGGGPISPNGAQATATATVVGGVITQVNIVYGGAGYFEPVIMITDPTGSGATATANVAYINQTVEGQEVYPFSGVDLSPFPGVGAIYMIKSVSVIYANYRYSLPMYSFSVYQAMVRQYPYQYQYVPTIGSQFGQGTSGSFYLYPIPSQPYQLEWDSFCLPINMTSDRDYEVIPQPWTDAVPYFSAYLAFLELQNWNSARGMLALFDQFVTRYGSYARPGRISNPYGRF